MHMFLRGRGFICMAVVCCLFLTCLGGTAFADALQTEEIFVYFDTVYVCVNGNMMEINTLSYNDTTYGEVRRFGENLGVEVLWDGDEKRAVLNSVPVLPAYKGGEMIELSPKVLEGKRILASFGVDVYFDGEPVDCVNASGGAAPPFILDGITYLPFRAIVESFGYSVNWDSATRTMFIGELPDPMPILKAEASAEPIAETIVYGYSEMGRELVAYRIQGRGNNSKTVFMIYTQHGFEDNNWRSGEHLRASAMRIKEHFELYPEGLLDYQLVIVPVANPDGLYDGINNLYSDKKGAFGRCTFTGVDMNRDWKVGRFKAPETRALHDLIVSYLDSACMLIDFHGYYNQVYGDTAIGNEFRYEFGFKDMYARGYSAGSGYLIGYAKESFGIPHCSLIEFKDGGSVDSDKTLAVMKKLFTMI